MTSRRAYYTGLLLRMFGRNWITLLGASLTTASGLMIIAFLILGFLELIDSPYIGILAFIALPVVFVFGLLLIPLGLYWEHRKVRGGGGEVPALEVEPYPKIDFNKIHVRRMALITGFLTVANLLIISIVSYEGVVYMDSTEFCGQVCHQVMTPEYTAHLDSPHSRVECVHCHIGPGAPWFVRSKLSGVGQVFAVTFNTYPRPIPTPVEGLRPSKDTCEQCHSPQKFTGDRIRILNRFADDENNTPLKTVLLMHIGGGNSQKGIHSWHIDPQKETTYISTDDQRQEIAWVQVKQEDGAVTEYHLEDSRLTPEQIRTAEKRVMDCIDCHNRPTHIYSLPAPALDQALADGRISPSLPYIKKLGGRVLEEAGATQSGAAEIALKVRQYYRETSPDLYNTRRDSIEDAIQELQAIYSRNVFPQMNVTWGTYPNNIGHQDFPGCFRCHDGEHVTEDGRTIDQDCSACHTLLAWEEESPEVLETLQIE